MSLEMVIFLFAFMFLILCINELYKKTNDYKNSKIDIKFFLDDMKSDLRIVNLGSTYSKFAFGTARELGLAWGDFSLQSQSLEMDYAILKKYAYKIAPQGVVIVVIAVCLLLYRETGDNYLYYDLFKGKENSQFKIKTKLKSFFPLLLHPKKFMGLVMDKALYYDIYDSYPVQVSKKKSLDEMEHLYKVWTKLFQLKNFEACNLGEENIRTIEQNCKILGDIINLCLDKNLRPIIVIPPFSKRLNIFFPEEFKDMILKQTIDKAVNNRDIPVLNYQDDEMFQEDTELFADGGFRLNRRGSKLFIRRFAEDLKKYGIVINNKKFGADEIENYQ